MSSNKHKMYDFEVTPPSHIWDKVAAALDESELNQHFPKKLQNATATPPAGVWNKISEALAAPQESQAPVVPMKRRFSPWLRYAAAAVLVGVIGFSAYQLTTPNETAGEVAAAKEQTATPVETAQPVSPIPAPLSSENTIAEVKVTSQPGNPNTGRYRSNGTIQATHASYADTEPSAQIAQANNRPHEDWRTNPLYAYEDHVPDLSDRYILLMTPEGKLVRVSKKLGDMVCCVAGEEQDDDCKNKLRKWQQKLAEMPVSSSPGNFLDILNMVSSLENSNL